MISQVKSNNDVCSQEMYGYGSLLVLITPFIEYVLKVIIRIIFHHSKAKHTWEIPMAVRGGGGHTKSYVWLLIGQEKSEFSQEKVRKCYRQSRVGTLFLKTCHEIYVRAGFCLIAKLPQDLEIVSEV